MRVSDVGHGCNLVGSIYLRIDCEHVLTRVSGCLSVAMSLMVAAAPAAFSMAAMSVKDIAAKAKSEALVAKATSDAIDAKAKSDALEAKATADALAAKTKSEALAAKATSDMLESLAKSDNRGSRAHCAASVATARFAQ